MPRSREVPWRGGLNHRRDTVRSRSGCAPRSAATGAGLDGPIRARVDGPFPLHVGLPPASAIEHGVAVRRGLRDGTECPPGCGDRLRRDRQVEVSTPPGTAPAAVAVPAPQAAFRPDRLNEIRRRQRKPRRLTEIATLDPLRPGHSADRGVAPLAKQPVPPARAARARWAVLPGWRAAAPRWPRSSGAPTGRPRW